MNKLAVIAVSAIVGTALISGLAGWVIGRSGSDGIRAHEGFTSAVNYDGTAIGLASERGGAGPGYSIAGAWWKGTDETWNFNSPTCIQPLTYGQKVRLGVMQIEPTAGVPGGTRVMWLECLDDNASPMEPSAIAAARTSLGQELGVNPSQITLLSTDEELWGDTSLVCPQEGMFYLQVIIQGFRLIFGHAGERYEYHTNEDGTALVKCDLKSSEAKFVPFRELMGSPEAHQGSLPDGMGRRFI